MSKITETLNNINKSKEVNLSSELIELGVAQDLKTLTNALGSQLSIDDKVIPETRQLQQQIEGLIKKAKDRAKTNDSISNASEKKTDLAIDAMKKAEAAAKEYGFKAEDIPNYKEVKKLADSVLKNIFDLEMWNDRLKQLIK